MVDIVEQLCIKSYELEDEEGKRWKAEQGQTYTTTVPEDNKEKVIVFSSFWVPVPKTNFVISEEWERQSNTSNC